MPSLPLRQLMFGPVGFSARQSHRFDFPDSVSERMRIRVLLRFGPPPSLYAYSLRIRPASGPYILFKPSPAIGPGHAGWLKPCAGGLRSACKGFSTAGEGGTGRRGQGGGENGPKNALLRLFYQTIARFSQNRRGFTTRQRAMKDCSRPSRISYHMPRGDFSS